MPFGRKSVRPEKPFFIRGKQGDPRKFLERVVPGHVPAPIIVHPGRSGKDPQVQLPVRNMHVVRNTSDGQISLAQLKFEKKTKTGGKPEFVWHEVGVKTFRHPLTERWARAYQKVIHDLYKIGADLHPMGMHEIKVSSDAKRNRWVQITEPIGTHHHLSYGVLDLVEINVMDLAQGSKHPHVKPRNRKMLARDALREMTLTASAGYDPVLNGFKITREGDDMIFIDIDSIVEEGHMPLKESAQKLVHNIHQAFGGVTERHKTNRSIAREVKEFLDYAVSQTRPPFRGILLRTIKSYQGGYLTKNIKVKLNPRRQKKQKLPGTTVVGRNIKLELTD
jgi:hypothetical protein